MNNFIKFILIALLILLGLFSLYYLQTILTYILIAGIFSLLGKPLFTILMQIQISKWHLPKGLCAGLTLVGFYLGIFGFISLFLPVIIEQVRGLTQINVIELSATLSKPLKELDKFLVQYSFNNGEKSASVILRESITSFFNMGNLSNIFGSFVGILGNVFAAIFSISFITFFFLTDSKLFYETAFKLVPRHLESIFAQVVHKTQHLLTRYFIGVLIQMTLITFLVTLGMFILGVPNAFLIGFFAGVINIIPYIGPVFGMIFGIFVGITTSIEYLEYSQLLPLGLKMLTVFLIVQLLDNSFFQPYIFSSSIKAHPLEIFLLVWVAATISGIPGMILAIPCYTILRVVLTEVLTQLGYITPMEEVGGDSLKI